MASGRPAALHSRHDREIARLAVPAFGALIAEPVYILTDTAIVGHLGTPQLAGLAVASSLLLSLYAVFVFLAYGTTAAVSRLLGAGDEREAAHQAVQSVWLAVMLGVAILAAGSMLAEPLVALMGAEGAVRDEALVYLRISLWGVPAMLAVLAGTGYLRGLQDTRTPLVVAVGTALLNLVVEVVLI
jgi:MATE family, multidrug efflux pump